jgi:hypothetical protein
MLTKIMKWLSVAVLLLAVLRLPTANFLVLLEFVICTAGLMVAAQAIRLRKYFWAAGFAAIAVFFNPIAPVPLPGRVFFWVDLVCLMTFLISLPALRGQPMLPVPLIANRRRGSEWL